MALPRGLIDWEWYEDANTTRLYIHILLTANWTTTQWRGITVQPGQKVTSLAHLAQETGLSVQNVRTSLNRLVSTSYLTIKTTNQYSVITIKNSDKHFAPNKQPTGQLTNPQQQSYKEYQTNRRLSSSITNQYSVITIKNSDKHFAPNKQPTGQLTNPQQQSYKEYQTNRRLSSSIRAHAGVREDRTTTSPLVLEYERQIGKLGEKARAELDAFGQKLGQALTLEIIRKCADLGGRSWAYVRKALTEAQAQGCTSPEEYRRTHPGGRSWAYVRKALTEAQAQGCTSPEEYRRTHPIGSGRAKRVDREAPSGNDFLQDAPARRRRMKKEGD